MGQELLDIPITSYHHRNRTKRKFYLATASTGIYDVRGSANKTYTHACISTSLTEWGWAVCAWSSRADLAKRNLSGYNKWGKNTKNPIQFEVVEVKEITAKEARQLRQQQYDTKKRIQEEKNK